MGRARTNEANIEHGTLNRCVMLLRPVFGVFSASFRSCNWPLLRFTPGLLRTRSSSIRQRHRQLQNSAVARQRRAGVLPSLAENSLCSRPRLQISVLRRAIGFGAPRPHLHPCHESSRTRHHLRLLRSCDEHWSFLFHLVTNLVIGPRNNSVSLDSWTMWIAFVAAPGVEILALVGRLQVFARASEMHFRANPGSAPIHSVES